MPLTSLHPPLPPKTRRSVIRVQQIASPLTRIGLGLDENCAHLILLHSGTIRLRRDDGGTSDLRHAPRLIWRVDGKGDELLAESGCRALVVGVPHIAFAQALPATVLGEQMRRTLSQDLSTPLPEDDRIMPLVAGLEQERHGTEPGAELAANHYLALLLVALWRIARSDLVAHGRAPQGLAERFLTQVGQRLHDHLRIADHARLLGVSRDRLGSAVRRATGLSPQAYIHQALIREASELLANTGTPVNQVAFRLGFADTAYFTRFFLRHRGISPSRFRRKAKEQRAAGDTSYSAWP